MIFIWSPSLKPCSTKSNISPLCVVEEGVNVPSEPETVIAPFKVILADIFSPAKVNFMEVALACVVSEYVPKDKILLAL